MRVVYWSLQKLARFAADAGRLSIESAAAAPLVGGGRPVRAARGLAGGEMASSALRAPASTATPRPCSGDPASHSVGGQTPMPTRTASNATRVPSLSRAARTLSAATSKPSTPQPRPQIHVLVAVQRAVPGPELRAYDRLQRRRRKIDDGDVDAERTDDRRGREADDGGDRRSQAALRGAACRAAPSRRRVGSTPTFSRPSVRAACGARAGRDQQAVVAQLLAAEPHAPRWRAAAARAPAAVPRCRASPRRRPREAAHQLRVLAASASAGANKEPRTIDPQPVHECAGQASATHSGGDRNPPSCLGG
jgi:hypothetical protein